MTPLALSYRRFSSERQTHGSSLERQTDLARKYAIKHQLTLDSRSYSDLGVSAFKSKNVEGALGAFIEAVDKKQIPRGSYLLVENFDRLSRDKVQVALELVLSILRKGIVIVTLFDEQVYSTEAIEENWTKLIIMLATQARAHEESLTKSKRTKDMRARKRANGDYTADRLPAWVEYEARRTNGRLVPEHTKTVLRVYELLSAGLSARAIAKVLNQDKVKPFGGGKEWYQIAVSRLLSNPAVYGGARLNTPDGEVVVDDVYPPVMSKVEWDRAQAVIHGRRKFRGQGRSNNPHNIFAGMSFCGHCGKRMRLVAQREKNYWYLKCVSDENGTKGKCFPKQFRFHDCELALVYELTHKGPAAIAADYYHERTDQRATLIQAIDAIKAKQAKLVALGAIAENVEAIGVELKKLQAEISRFNSELAAISPHPVSHEEMEESMQLFDEYIVLANLLEDWGNPRVAKDLKELRMRIKSVMSRALNKIEFLNTSKKGWEPALRITYISNTQNTVQVVPLKRTG